MTLFVYWGDDPDRKRELRGVCSRCQVAEQREFGQSLSLKNPCLVSPTGIVHGQHWDFHERTSCGKDATGPDWWWRE